MTSLNIIFQSQLILTSIGISGHLSFTLSSLYFFGMSSISHHTLAAFTFQCKLPLKFSSTLLFLLLSLSWWAHPLHDFISYLYSITDHFSRLIMTSFRNIAYPIFLKHLHLKDLSTSQIHCAQIKCINLVYPLHSNNYYYFYVLFLNLLFLFTSTLIHFLYPPSSNANSILCSKIFNSFLLLPLPLPCCAFYFLCPRLSS